MSVADCNRCCEYFQHGVERTYIALFIRCDSCILHALHLSNVRDPYCALCLKTLKDAKLHNWLLIKISTLHDSFSRVGAVMLTNVVRQYFNKLY